MAYLVAVTACVSGVAHTYMAAERLEKLCLLEKWGVSIETQGALGTENRLADEDIRRADVALLITDIELAGAERFEHCRYVQQALDVLIPLKIRQIHLLPFHQYGEPKYRLLGKTWSMKEVPAPSSADVTTMREMAERAGFQVTVGG